MVHVANHANNLAPVRLVPDLSRIRRPSGSASPAPRTSVSLTIATHGAVRAILLSERASET